MTVLRGASARSVRLASGALILFILLFTMAGMARAGTWSPVARTAPSASGGLMLLLTDGTVMCKSSSGGGDGVGNVWNRLTPDSAGSYVNGTWSTLTPMADTRLYFSSQVLKDGRVFVAGGEYGTGGAKGETYDPLSNTWTAAPVQGSTISDANSELLPDGRVLVALVTGTLRSTIIFDPVANVWTPGPTANGIHNESAWVKLPDGSSLMVDRLSTNSERYIPSLNQWVVDATVPVQLYDAFGDETGPGFLLPDGRAFFIGSPSTTAYYTPSGTNAPGTWAAGPAIPGGQGAPDAPGAMMPNGKILCTLSPAPTSANHFPTPTKFYEFDYTTNTFTQITTPTGGTQVSSIGTYVTNMLVLPDGSVLYNQQGVTQYYVYAPGGTPLAAGKPTISAITQNGDGSFHLAGTKLNGISQGAAYGDDWQMSTNYPIVRLTSGSNAYYARTFNWSSAGVMTGSTPVTTEFTVPGSVPAGVYSLVVVANGIASDPVSFTFGSLSSNADLSALSLSAGTLTPVFAAGTTGYTASVPNATASITVTPTVADTAATVKVNGTAVTSGSASGAISLALGANGIAVVVTAQDGSTRTYTVTVSRALSSNANLSALSLSAGTLSPAFAAGTTGYAANVTNATPSITVTPTVADGTATVKVNGTSVASGSASGAIILAVGANAISTIVTAQDGSTKTYTVTVTRNGGVSVAFNSAADVPMTAAGYTAAGNALYVALNFAPAPGTNLTVVNNTGMGFIAGAFDNLAQGQAVMLTFSGATFTFVADYFGGTGNDLVLHWANSRPVAWGFGTTGQLGSGSSANSSVPVAVNVSGVLANKTLTAAAAGQNHTVALCADGTLAAWGVNSSGQLGNGTFANSNVPVAVSKTGALLNKTVIAIASGHSHCLALCSDGTVAAWGANASGQLGNGSTSAGGAPVAVNTAGALLNKVVIAIAAGQSHSLALCSDGTVAAWGANASGQLGNNTTVASSVPVTVSVTGTPLATRTVVALAAGLGHSLALCSDGTVVSWGLNGNAQLGNGTYADSGVPVAVSTAGTPLAGRPVSAIAAGSYFSMALCSDGTLASWGNNGSGQLGDGSGVTQRPEPVAVQIAGTPLAGRSVRLISASAYGGFALCTDGTLVGWGYNGEGELGTGSTTSVNVPTAVSTAPLVAGERFALIASGQSAFHGIASVAIPYPAPVVTTLAATSVTATTVTLNGNVNPGGVQANVTFEEGTSISYGTIVAATPGSVTGGSATPVSVNLSGLHAGTTYHFRVTAVSAYGTAAGSDMTFTTSPATPQDWRLRWFGTTSNAGIAADSADPYNTGVPNLVAFALLGPEQNPALAAPRLLPQSQIVGGNLVVTFTQPAAVSGVTYGAEWRAELGTGSWLPLADSGSGGLHVFSVPIAGHPRAFIRITISEP